MIDLNNARKQFEEYLKGYDGSDSKIHLKAVHTFCVMEAADSICQGEGFSQEEKEIFQRLLIKAGNNMLSKLGADQNKRRRKR